MNKVVAVVGSFVAAGSPLHGGANWTKLASTAAVGARELHILGDVSGWPAGAQLGVSATEYPEPPDGTQTEV